jgi:GNAT superfamily N-acetyltransferase
MSDSTNPPIQVAPSDLIFQDGTPEQREQAWRINSVSWKGPMSIEQYLSREVHLMNQELCANGRCKYWVLVSAKDPLDIIASCETIQKTVLASNDSGFQVLKGYGIASVYTNPKYRRQGMAATLINHLKNWFDTEGETDLSVLYSDIGSVSWSLFGEWHLTSIRNTTQSSVGQSFL